MDEPFLNDYNAYNAEENYPGGMGDVSSLVYERTVLACNETPKPVLSLLQTFLAGGYFPTGEDIESMISQALMGGADAIGYFCIRNAYGDVHLPDIFLKVVLD